MHIHYTKLEELLLYQIGNAKKTVMLFSPYLKLEIVNKILEVLPNAINTIIVTKLVPDDFASGSSDLDAISIAFKNRIAIYINNKIHLKSYIFDNNLALIGSANLTNRGLQSNATSNYETIVEIELLDKFYLHYLDRIISTSELMNLEKIEFAKSQMHKYSKASTDLDYSNSNLFNDIFKDDEILASRLPHTESIKILYEKLTTQSYSIEPLIAHDAEVFKLYTIPKSLSEFHKILYPNFVNHPFMRLLFASFEESINFGGVRKLLEKTCIDNPRPSRIQINILINNFFNWLEELQGNSYYITQPNHTKILFKRGINEKN